MSGIHHEFSPSKSERLKNCPPSYWVCKDWSPLETDDSSHGTLLHKAIYDDESYNQLSSNDKSIIDNIRIEHIMPFQDKTLYPNLEHYSELYVEIRDYENNNELITAGTCDDVMVNGNIASLKDWKFGSYEVTNAQENMQIKEYVIGLFQKFPNVHTIYAVIIQPCYWDGNFDDKQAVFTRDMLNDLIEEIKQIKEKCLNSDINDFKQYSCNTDNCRYCNKNACKVYNQNLLIAAQSYGIDVLNEKLPSEELLHYSDDMLCKAKILKDMIEEKEKICKNVILKAGGSTNFVVVDGRKSKKIDWNAIVNELARKYIHVIARLKKWYLIIPIEYLENKSKSFIDKIISKHTKENQGEPYVKTRMRKNNYKQNKLN